MFGCKKQTSLIYTDAGCYPAGKLIAGVGVIDSSGYPYTFLSEPHKDRDVLALTMQSGFTLHVHQSSKILVDHILNGTFVPVRKLWVGAKLAIPFALPSTHRNYTLFGRLYSLVKDPGIFLAMYLFHSGFVSSTHTSPDVKLRYNKLLMESLSIFAKTKISHNAIYLWLCGFDDWQKYKFCRTLLSYSDGKLTVAPAIKQKLAVILRRFGYNVSITTTGINFMLSSTTRVPEADTIVSIKRHRADECLKCYAPFSFIINGYVLQSQSIIGI